MSTNANAPDNVSGTADAQLTGPHTEFDKYDRPTGATYFRCESCGAESLTREFIHRASCPHR